jgi:protein-disulfide isomerase
MKDYIKRNIVFIGVITATIVLVVGGTFLFTKGGTGTTEKKIDTSRLVSQNSTRTSGYANGTYLPASPSATVTLVEFGDYECPACSVYSPMIKQLLTEFSGKITYVFRNYPLPQHKNAPLSSYTVEAAGLQGKYWQMHEKLFATQSEWSKLSDPKDTFMAYARELGVDITKFNTDLESTYIKDLVQNDVADGNAIALTETPTFYLNDLKITVSGSYEEFRNLVRLVIPN